MTAPSTLHELIERRAAERPLAPYMISAEDGAVLGYGALRDSCRALGRQLAGRGLAAGDVVSVFLPNGEQTARLLLGIMANGLIANPINLLCQASQLRHILRHSDTRLVYTSEEGAQILREPLADAGRPIELVIVRAGAHGLPEDGAPAAFAPPEPGQDALLMYTSGTTGVPKGVLLTHANLVVTGHYISAEHQLGSGDRVLASLPLYHINGLVVTAIAPLVHGGSVVMTERFSVATFWRDAARHECTWINVVPTIIAYLLNDNADTGGLDLSRLRFCRSASAALPPEHHKAFERRFGIGIIETMGMTETAAPAFSNPLDPARRKVGSIGRPSGTEARVIDAEGRTLGPGQVGEIVLRGGNVMRGYYKAPEETAKAFTADGWLRSGDLGYCDEEGYFYINGRAKELIIKGGENIAPREIDEALIQHPSVLEAAAVGVPDPHYGQEIAAYVVLRDAASWDEEDLRAHCLRTLGRYKTPSEFHRIEQLPRGPSGKVQRLKLLDQGDRTTASRA
jgi:long-chain acyl-CoA synthetase